MLNVTYNSTKIIDSLKVTPLVSVTYNGSTIATLNFGDTKTLQCSGKVMASDIVVTVFGPRWPTPTIALNGDTVSTPLVEGVTKYKVYDNNTYIGYVDSDNIWHGGDQ